MRLRVLHVRPSANRAAAMPGAVPSKTFSLSWEPMKLLTSLGEPREAMHIATLELSTFDLLFDNYNSVVLFYDAGKAGGAQRKPTFRSAHRDDGAASEFQKDGGAVVTRIKQALESLLAYYPCAAGLLVHNKSRGRLEIRYLVQKHGNDGAGAQNGGSSMPAQPNDDGLNIRRSCGMLFKVAHADVSLADLGDLSYPQPWLDVLMPSKPDEKLDGDGDPLPRFVMALQVTTFKCGGFAIGHTGSHTYADGYTAAVFIQNLCSLARGAGIANSQLRETYPRSALIRPRQPPSPTISFDEIITCARADNHLGQRIHYGTASRFQFPVDVLESLRESVSTPGTKPCSRNKALMALLWTALARVNFTVRRLAGNHLLDFWFPVNVREKHVAGGRGYMGNAVCMVRVLATLQELCENDLAFATGKINKAVEDLDVGECFQSMVDYVELQVRDGRRPLMGSIGMPSLVGLPFYDTDCGCGPPVYVGRPSQQISDRCIIMDHPAAQAWNVLVVFPSIEEHACFAECVGKYCRL